MRNAELGMDSEEDIEGDSADRGVIDDTDGVFQRVKAQLTEFDQKLVQQILERADVNFKYHAGQWSNLLLEMSDYLESFAKNPTEYDDDDVTAALQDILSETNELVVN